MDHIHPQNRSYRLPVLLQTVVISFSREDSARAKTHSFQHKPRDRPQSAPAFFQRSKKVQIVHSFCLFHSILLVLDFLPARPLWLGHRQQNSLFPSSAENHSRADARSNIRGRETFDTPRKAVSIIHEIRLLYKKKKPPHFVLYCRAALHSGPGVRDRLSVRISTAAKRPPQPANSSMASRVLSAENRNAPVLLYTSTCPPTCLMMQSIR